MEKGGFGFSYIYQFHKNIAIETGFRYNSYSSKTHNVSVIFLGGNPEKVGEVNIRNSLRTFSFPIKINGIILNKSKWRLYAQGGILNEIVFNIVNRADIKYYDPFYGNDGKQKGKSSYNYKRHLLGITAGIGVDYFPIDKLMIRFEPNMLYSVYSNIEISIKELPYSFGCSLGVFYRFGI